MTIDERPRAKLGELAQPGVSSGHDADLSAAVARGHRKRLTRRLTVGAAATAMVAVALISIATRREDKRSTVVVSPDVATTEAPATTTTVSPSTTATPPTAAPTTTPSTIARPTTEVTRPALPTTTSVPPAGAEQLAAFTWSSLPAAPIQPRSGASVVWTGHELVVWGGVLDAQNQYVNDGAAYNPATSTWRTLPTPAGLGPRHSAVPIWTGTEVLIIGGAAGQPADAPTTDGAYDPDANQWRTLPARPGNLRQNITAVWTGTTTMVLSNERTMASYDPVADQWRSLPSLPEPAGRDLTTVIPLWAGSRLLVWVEWSYPPTATANGSTGGPSGIDLWSFDLQAGRWTRQANGTVGPGGIDTALWTGTQSVLSASDIYRSEGAKGPGPTSNRHGFRYDIATNTYRPITHGPVDDASVGALWTGAAMVRVAQGQIGGPNQINPGDTAAWDPTTDTWTTLPKGPVSSYDEKMVWTGSEILAYGAQVAVRFGPS